MWYMVMELGRVRGSLVLNKTLPALRGKKLRVVEEVDARNVSKTGKLIITFDYIGAGEGQLVYYEGGPESWTISTCETFAGVISGRFVTCIIVHRTATME